MRINIINFYVIIIINENREESETIVRTYYNCDQGSTVCGYLTYYDRHNLRTIFSTFLLNMEEKIVLLREEKRKKSIKYMLDGQFNIYLIDFFLFVS